MSTNLYQYLELFDRLAEEESLCGEERLEAAVALLESVKEELNNRAAPCATCGRVSYEDFDQAASYKALEGAITRSQRTKNVLRGLPANTGLGRD